MHGCARTHTQSLLGELCCWYLFLQSRHSTEAWALATCMAMIALKPYFPNVFLTRLDIAFILGNGHF